MITRSCVNNVRTVSANERGTSANATNSTSASITNTVNTNIETDYTCCDRREITSPVTITLNIDNRMKKNATQTISRDDFVELRSICPGAAEYFSRQKTKPAIFHASVSDCTSPARDDRSRHGVVYGVCNDSSFCQFLVRLRRNKRVHAEIKLLSPGCTGGNWTTWLYDRWNQPLNLPSLEVSSCRVPQSFLSKTNQMYVLHQKSPKIQIWFRAVPIKFEVVHTSQNEGIVTLRLWEAACVERAQFCGSFKAPKAHVLLVSFGQLKLFNEYWLLSLHFNEDRKLDFSLRTFLKDDFKGERIFKAVQMRLCFILLDSSLPNLQSCLKVKMHFSFFPMSKVPQRLRSGLYNCSVDHYWMFQQHLDCNQKIECEDGRDERGHCPFSSQACQGWVAARHKCYKLFMFEKTVTAKRALVECRMRGSELASMRTAEEDKDLHELFHDQAFFPNVKYAKKIVGLWSRIDSKPFMYRKFFRWYEKTMLYTMNHTFLSSYSRVDNGFYEFVPPRKYAPYRPSRHMFLCEKYVMSKALSVVYLRADHKLSTIMYKQQMLSVCQSGQITHDFLSCDPKSGCAQSLCLFFNRRTQFLLALPVRPEYLVKRVAMFTCTKSNTEISYTLVCDFTNNCEDKSDESFCQHPLCKAFSCNNGQCVSMDKRCNELSDCLDDSDEKNCGTRIAYHYEYSKKENGKRFLINLDGKGFFTRRLMTDSEPCPDTHYRCATAMVHCLPIYTRCNELYDCLYHEDERDCEDITCPALYRCRDSTVCVHVDHVCDGWSQCPQRDDEWLCGMVCPPQCLCQGHAFLCSQPFPAHLFPQLRYLDARGSGMTLDNVINNAYLVNLNLADCSIQALSNIEFLNLRIIDLSWNEITTITMNVFLNCKNLRVLVLRGNPLSSVTNTVSNQRHHSLRTLDLSKTHIGVIDSQLLSLTPEIRFLNISFCDLLSIGPQGFQSLHEMKELDIRGNFIQHFPHDIFRGLSSLDLILSAHYRLCCSDILPKRSSDIKCVAQQSVLSSCQNLFATDFYRPLYLSLSILAVLGNVACFFSNLVIRRNICVFMVCLHCANLCMGIYTTVIAAAQEMFLGQYSKYEQRWTSSVACKVAGFMWLLSSEVSVLTIFLFTVDLLIVLCFPLSVHRFNETSAVVVCATTWLVGILLAVIPLFPGLSHFGHYGQTGMCTLMTHASPTFQIKFGLFQCIAVFNCLSCIAILIGQAKVKRSVSIHPIMVESSMKHVCASVGLKMKIAVTDAVGWIAVTACIVLGIAGMAESQRVNVFLSVVVLPLNSAVNPLLYLWHTVTYRQQKEMEERLLHVLKSKMCSSSTN